MAAARKLDSLHENFLTCSICMEGYKDPCTLTCGHTFCKGCLGEFLKTRQDAIGAKSIPCPFCRQMTRVPRPDRPVEEWMKQIKPSFLIQGLLYTLACGGNTHHGNDNDCFSCEKLGVKSEARSHCQDCAVPLCDRCVEMHLANPATSEHDIGDIGDGAKVTPDPVLQSRVTTKKKYRCLAALSKSILAAGCVYPACVDILDISGEVLRSISTLNTGENPLSDPRFLCTTPHGHILVSNDDSNFLFCMTPEGKAVFTYRPTGEAAMRGPRGITTTRTGHILVADKWTNKVTLLTAAGEFVRDLLTSEDGIEQPYGLSVHGDKLFVTQRNTTVKVFHCSRSV